MRSTSSRARRSRRAFAELEERAREDLDDPALRRRADLRYRRQAFELTVEADDLDALADRFHAAHEQRYGYRMDDEPVELVNVRARSPRCAVEKPELREEDRRRTTANARRGEANIDGEWVETAVLRRAALGRGSRLEGPADRGVRARRRASCGRAGRARSTTSGTLVLERAE